jgi:hypothetical protein
LTKPVPPSPSDIRKQREARDAQAERAKLDRALRDSVDAGRPGQVAKIKDHIRHVTKKAMLEQFAEPWSGLGGTPETYAQIETVPSHRRQEPLSRMAKLGTISPDELAAAHEISSIVEMIERTVGMGSASLEARVDYQSSARDALIESLGRIRAEVAYRAWRESIPVPRRMILDMLLTNVPYVRLASNYGLHWRTARKRLISALRMWPSFKIAARHECGKSEVLDLYLKLGEGTLLPPKPKPERLPQDDSQ